MDLRASRTCSNSSPSSRSSSCDSVKSITSSKILQHSPFYNCKLGELNKTLPKSTTLWNRFCLDNLGICYHTEFIASPLDILDMASNQTGCFEPLYPGEQKQYIDMLKEKLVFNIASSDFHEMLFDTASTQQRLREFLEEIKIQSNENFSSAGPSYLAYELLHDVANILRYEAAEHEQCRMWQGPASKALYKTAFTHFARMCWIEALPGSLWKSKMRLCLTDVESCTDVLLMPIKSPLHLGDDLAEADTVSVVSFVEMKKAAYKRMKSPDDEYSGSSIYDYFCPDVLARHGGELLLHSPFYAKKLFGGKNHNNQRTLPGIIVVGTEVIFTLLQTNNKHMSEVYTQPVVNEKATIYYSKPKDYMKKEDRDILMEAIIRLNNV